MESSHVDYVSAISAFVGVVLGLIVTLITSWYFSRLSDKKLEKIARGLLKDLPSKSASVIQAKNAANITVAALPLIASLLTRQPVLDFIQKIAGFTNEEIENSNQVLKIKNDLSQKVFDSLREHRLRDYLDKETLDEETRNSVISFLEGLNEKGITLSIKFK